MYVHQFEKEIEGFTYQVWYAHGLEGWIIEGIQITRGSKQILPVRPLHGTFATDSDALASANKSCELIIKHILTLKFEEP